jgi:diguanylate cyclase (GGDEF)-like protein
MPLRRHLPYRGKCAYGLRWHGEAPLPAIRGTLHRPLKTRTADVDAIAMPAIRIRPGAIPISTRFFVALFVLLASLTAVSVLGLRGLQDVQRANDQVFADNLLTAEATSQLAIDLGSAQRIGLEITAISGAKEVDELRAQLDQVVVPKVNADIARFLHLHAADPPSERARLERIPSAWKAVALTEGGALESVGESLSTRQRTSAADGIADVMDPLIVSVSGRQSVERDAASEAHAGAQSTFSRSRTWLIIVTVIALLAALAMLLVGLTLKRLVDQRATDERFDESESEYIDALQVTEQEDEAQDLLRRQVERSLEDARAVVLVRNNSADRLEARTPLIEIDGLREPLLGATPGSCLAVRSGRGHAESAEGDALVRCPICGGLPGATTCEPLLVGGEVIGVVLIAHPTQLYESSRQRIREMVAHAAPVLANLRNLAVARLQAATDALTGLPNRRSVEDTMRRMVAQSARNVAPLAALLLDLDHFKKINDVYGHDRGDEVLAAAGVALRKVVRESDFVGRYGGEEFLLLLPATDKRAALLLAEQVRTAIAGIRVAGVDRVTASVGVAVLPDDAGDAVDLFRSADRALYSAKSNGRDRVEAIGAEDRSLAELGATPVCGWPRRSLAS